jgi:hypothetical protein
LREGVFIIAKPGMHDPTAEEAAELLCYVLKDNQVGCDAWPMLPEGRHWPSQVPDDAIQILVGRKPMAYLKHPDNPELLKLSIESENREKTMSDQDKRDRQYILEQRRAVLRQNAPPKPN